MSFPRNEAETISLFRVIQNGIGWRIVESQSNAFPDAVLESDDGERLTCEFEYLSKNFKKHGHPVDDGCQLIICWHDDWPESPLPVMALEDCAAKEAKVIGKLLVGSVPWADYKYLKDQVRKLETELGEIKASKQIEWEEEDIEQCLGEVYEEVMFDIGLRELERQHGLEEGILTNQGNGWLKVRNSSNERVPFLVKQVFAIFAVGLFYLLLHILGILPS